MSNTNSTWNETSDGNLSRLEDEDFGLKNDNNELIHLRTLSPLPFHTRMEYRRSLT